MNNKLTIWSTALFSLVLSVSVYAQFNTTYTTTDLLDTSTRLLSDFDIPEGSDINIQWRLESSQYITRTEEKPFPQLGFVEAFPNTYGRIDINTDKTYRVMGVRGAFNLKTYNYIEMVPYEIDRDGQYIRFDSLTGEPLPGVFIQEPIIRIGMTVWGNGRPYDVEAHVESSKGDVVTIPLGTTEHNGWKLVSSAIPSRIYSNDKVFKDLDNKFVSKILKFTLWSTPDDPVDDFIVYFDEIFFSIAISKPFYDGYELETSDVIEAINWQSQEE